MTNSLELFNRTYQQSPSAFVGGSTNLFTILRSALLLFLLTGASRVEAQCVFLDKVSSACLDAADSAPLSSRTPLILVHGWNRDSIPGRGIPEAWQNFLTYYGEQPDFQVRVKPYRFAYDSNVVDIEALGRALRDVIDRADVRDPSGFGGKPFVIVAHSMGGLVVREALRLTQLDGPRRGITLHDRITKLITLGTPHHGSPLANGPSFRGLSLALDDELDTFESIYYPGGTTWKTVNRSDLWWDNYDGLFNCFTCDDKNNVRLRTLNGSTSADSKLIAYAGYIGVSDPLCLFFGDALCWGNAILLTSFGFRTDGIVPLQSALLIDSGLGQPRPSVWRVFEGYNHEDIHNGKQDKRLFDQLRADVLAAVASGEPPWAPRNAAVSVGASTVSLLWDPPLGGGTVSSYLIEMGSVTERTDLGVVDTGNTRPSSMASLASGTYYIRVRSKGPGGLSSASNEVKVTVGTTGLVAYYPFDSSALDVSGSGNDGSVVGVVNIVGGKLGNAFRFDGVTGHVFIPDSSSLRVTRFTLSAWVNLSANVGGNRILEKGNSDSYWLDVNSNGRLVLGFFDGAYHDLGGSSILQLNTWYFVTGTYDGAALRLYLNGNLMNSLSVTSAPRVTTEAVLIGWKLGGIPDDRFAGTIDEVRIYNRALSLSEIQAIFAAR